jgi:hypothetical protein
MMITHTSSVLDIITLNHTSIKHSSRSNLVEQKKSSYIRGGFPYLGLNSCAHLI